MTTPNVQSCGKQNKIMVNISKIAHLAANFHDIKSSLGNTFTMIIIVMKLLVILLTWNYLGGIMYILQEKQNPDM